MAKIRPHLSRAPITEAVIDIHVSADGVSLDDVKSYASQVDGFERVSPLFQLETVWAVNRKEGPEHRSGSQEIGVRLHSGDGRYVIQARTQGLAISRLEPYQDWERLLANAKAQWARFVRVTKPAQVVRVATRYINKLRLPMRPGEQFEEYLTKPPAVPDELPQGVLGFTQQLVMVKPEIDARANVTLVLAEGPAPADHVPVVLDIDVYHSVTCSAESEDLWNLLERLRVFKNEIFFASITERTAGLFE